MIPYAWDAGPMPPFGHLSSVKSARINPALLWAALLLPAMYVASASAIISMDAVVHE